jgi:hypothetical protein
MNWFTGNNEEIKYLTEQIARLDARLKITEISLKYFKEEVRQEQALYPKGEIIARMLHELAIACNEGMKQTKNGDLGASMMHGIYCTMMLSIMKRLGKKELSYIFEENNYEMDISKR